MNNCDFTRMDANQNRQTDPLAQDSRPLASIGDSTSETTRLSLRDIVGRGYAVEDAADQRVSERIAEAFRNGQRVELLFANVELTMAAFLAQVVFPPPTGRRLGAPE